MTIVRVPIGCSVITETSWGGDWITFIYDTDRPFEIKATFRSGPVWAFARDLLRDGINHPAGTGDVRIWPTRTTSDCLFLHLRAPSGEALIELSKDAVGRFLFQTDVLLPAGTEQAWNLDVWLGEVLGEKPEAP